MEQGDKLSATTFFFFMKARRQLLTTGFDGEKQLEKKKWAERLDRI